MNIRDFIGTDTRRAINTSSIWETSPIVDEEKCNEYEFDASFFDNIQRVENKYKNITGYDLFDRMSLEELAQIVNPPLEGFRTVILGTTEYLLPYVAYCLKFVSANDLDIESGKRNTLPFIFFAPAEWSMSENMKFIDCLSYYYRDSKYTFNVFISKDKTMWLTPGGEPRITIYELYRLYKILGDIPITIEDDHNNPNTYKIIIHNQRAGKNTKRKRYKKSKKRSKKQRNKRRYSKITTKIYNRTFL